VKKQKFKNSKIKKSKIEISKIKNQKSKFQKSKIQKSKNTKKFPYMEILNKEIHVTLISLNGNFWLHDSYTSFPKWKLVAINGKLHEIKCSKFKKSKFKNSKFKNSKFKNSRFQITNSRIRFSSATCSVILERYALSDLERYVLSDGESAEWLGKCWVIRKVLSD